MRIFTDKEHDAVTNAYMVFMREMTGKKYQSKTAKKYVCSLLEDGLTFDEIFNPLNYIRYIAYLKQNAVNEKDTIEDFIDKMKQLYIDVRKLNDDDWIHSDHKDLVINCLQKFYATYKEAGVVFSRYTSLSVCNAITKYGMQTMMNEELINKYLDTGNAPGLAHFSKWLLESQDGESIAKASEPTEEQVAREKLRTYVEEEDERTPHKESNGETEGEIPVDSDECRIVDEQEIRRTVEGEPEAEARVTTMGVSEEPEYDAGAEQPARTEGGNEDEQNPEIPETFFDVAGLTDTEDENNEAIFIGKDPQTYKKECIISIMANYTPGQLEEISRYAEVDGENTLENIAEALAEGRYSVRDESDAAMNVHNTMNMDLSLNWENIMREQGIEPDEKLRVNSDPLVERWDMRDDATRKLQKLRKIILAGGNDAIDDEDIQQIFRDLESKYEADKKEINY